MPLDPAIPLQIRTPQVQSPLESYGRAVSLQSLLQNQELGRERLKQEQIQTQQQQRAISDEQAIRDTFAQNPNATEAELLQKLGTRAVPLLKARREQQKADLETQIKGFELNAKKVGRFGDIVGTIKDDASMTVGIGQALAEGIIDREEAGRYLSLNYEKAAPQLSQLAQMSLTRKEQLELAQKEAAEKRAQLDFEATLPGKQADSATKQITADQMQKQGMTNVDAAQLEQQRLGAEQRAADAAAGRAVTKRGQDMTDSRQREMAEITRETKPATEAELKNFGFYERYKQANEVVKKLQDSGDINPLKLKLPDSANIFLTADEQAYKQAERQLVEAYLRRDSGAAIAQSEYQNARKTLGLDVGDKQSTKEQKARSRDTHLDSLRASAGRAYKQRYGEPAITQEASAGAPAAPPPPKLGEIRKGYVFLGGDPADKSRWKKQ